MKNMIMTRSYDFACAIIKFGRLLPKETTSFVLGKQLIAAGTSIAANIEEAQGAFSKDDFIYKMQTALKEARETNLWLRLINDSELAKGEELSSLIQESSEIKNILGRIVKTSKVRK